MIQNWGLERPFSLLFPRKNIRHHMETQQTTHIEVSRLKNEIKRKDKLLQEKNVEVTNCLYTITHELKTPIISIRGYSNLLQDFHSNELSIELKNYLDRITRNVNQIEMLIDDLFRFARINSARCFRWVYTRRLTISPTVPKAKATINGIPSTGSVSKPAHSTTEYKVIQLNIVIKAMNMITNRY